MRLSYICSVVDKISTEIALRVVPLGYNEPVRPGTVYIHAQLKPNSITLSSSLAARRPSRDQVCDQLASRIAQWNMA